MIKTPYDFYKITTFVLLLIILGIVGHRFMIIQGVGANVPAGYIKWKKQVHPELYWTVPLGNSPSNFLGDINGDGLVDVIQFEGAVYLNTARPSEGFSGYVYDPIYTASLSSVQSLKSFFKPYSLTAAGIRVVDINNDSLVDILQKFISNSVTYEGVYINTGVGWEKDSRYFIPMVLGTADSGEYNVPLVDLNGDGLVDMIDLPRYAVYMASPVE